MNPKNDKFDIIVLAGQSNASGCGWGQTTMPWEINPKIKMLRGMKCLIILLEYLLILLMVLLLLKIVKRKRFCTFLKVQNLLINY